MDSDIKEKVGHVSPKVVIPIFVVILLILGAGLVYAYNPDNFRMAADSVSLMAKDSTNRYLPKVAAKLGTAIKEDTSTFGGKGIPDEPKKENNVVLPEISKAVVIIYPTQTDKSKGNAGTPPVYVGKAIELDLSSQRMFIWENGQLIQSWVTSTGKPEKPTKQGNFKILSKMRWAYGSSPEGDQWAMPYWLGFYFSGGTENGIHGLPLINGRKEGAGSLGIPVSHGCVRVADSNIEWLYSWAEIGTPVIVHK
ncbi:MAG: L,D-transpeptidase [Candidatus Berkelbacteria bacterium]|nr:L,D-transpeptidase [Candidatus Berkelbacteria bacterium]